MAPYHPQPEYGFSDPVIIVKPWMMDSQVDIVIIQCDQVFRVIGNIIVILSGLVYVIVMLHRVIMMALLYQSFIIHAKPRKCDENVFEVFYFLRGIIIG